MSFPVLGYFIGCVSILEWRGVAWPNINTRRLFLFSKMPFEVHIFHSNSPSPSPSPSQLPLTIHYGADWWIEENEKKEAISYKIMGQYTSTGGERAICVKRMPKDWVGDCYLGSQSGLVAHRMIYRNVLEVPNFCAEWEIMLKGSLDSNTV